MLVAHTMALADTSRQQLRRLERWLDETLSLPRQGVDHEQRPYQPEGQHRRFTATMANTAPE